MTNDTRHHTKEQKCKSAFGPKDTHCSPPVLSSSVRRVGRRTDDIRPRNSQLATRNGEELPSIRSRSMLHCIHLSRQNSVQTCTTPSATTARRSADSPHTLQTKEGCADPCLPSSSLSRNTCFESKRSLMQTTLDIVKVIIIIVLISPVVIEEIIPGFLLL